MRVTEELESDRDTCAALTRPCPDLVVIDLDRRDPESWLGVVTLVRSRCPSAVIIAIGTTSTFAARAVAAGADTFCSKLESPRALCDTLDATLGKRTATRPRE